MIAALRRRHRLAWRLLALVAPAVLVAALRMRAAQPFEVAPELPGTLLGPPGAATPAPDLAGAPRFAGLPLRVRVRSAADGAGRLLELQPEEPLLEPDVLAYVLPGTAHGAALSAGAAGSADAPLAETARSGAEQASGTALPGEARLLGPLSGTLARRWPLPADAAELLLYSLGHQQVLARGPLPAPTPEPPAAATPVAEPPGGAR